MKNCAWALVLWMVFAPVVLFAQSDTVDVPDFFTNGEGTLNDAVTAKINAGTLSNTVFRHNLYLQDI